MSLRARTSVLDEWVKEKGSEKEWFWWSEILMGIPGGEAFGFVVVALCLLADQTVIQAVWSLVVWGRLVPRLCSCELWTCTLSHLRDQWDTPLAAAVVLIVVYCRLHIPFRAFSTTSVPCGEVQSVKTRHLTNWFRSWWRFCKCEESGHNRKIRSWQAAVLKKQWTRVHWLGVKIIKLDPSNTLWGRSQRTKSRKGFFIGWYSGVLGVQK